MGHRTDVLQLALCVLDGALERIELSPGHFKEWRWFRPRVSLEKGSKVVLVAKIRVQGRPFTTLRLSACIGLRQVSSKFGEHGFDASMGRRVPAKNSSRHF